MNGDLGGCSPKVVVLQKVADLSVWCGVSSPARRVNLTKAAELCDCDQALRTLKPQPSPPENIHHLGRLPGPGNLAVSSEEEDKEHPKALRFHMPHSWALRTRVLSIGNSRAGFGDIWLLVTATLRACNMQHYRMLLYPALRKPDVGIFLA